MASGGASWEREFPLHWAVWRNDLDGLSRLVDEGGLDLEKRDPRGRTAAELGVRLGRVEAVSELLKAGADAAVSGPSGWALSHEATATGDPELLMLVLHHREAQRALRTKKAMQDLLALLQDTPDYYLEMSWEFSSWVPFVERLCPSDTYRVYKCGPAVRVDATLVGFDGSHRWQRGKQSYLFKAEPDGQSLQSIVIDHEAKQAVVDTVTVEQLNEGPQSFASFRPSEEEIANRLTSPIVTTDIDIEKIAFERNKSGLFWKADKEEVINDYPCKVFSASNVELVTRTRKEHLSQRDKEESENRNATPMDSLLKFVQGSEVTETGPVLDAVGPGAVTPAEYFDPDVDLGVRDIGRPKELSRRAQSFKATLWLSEEFPLSLAEQVMPIIDLMAVNSAHFQRLKDFIQLQLPSGFPVKIEIPLFNVIQARITFGNVNALSRPRDGVLPVKGKCTFAPEVFEIPASYRIRQTESPKIVGRRGGNEDELLLQWTIQQSMLEEGEVGAPIDAQLQAAIQASLNPSGTAGGIDPALVSWDDRLPLTPEQIAGLNIEQSYADATGRSGETAPWDRDMAAALAASAAEEEARRAALEAEEAELAEALRLSLLQDEPGTPSNDA